MPSWIEWVSMQSFIGADEWPAGFDFRYSTRVSTRSRDHEAGALCNGEDDWQPATLIYTCVLWLPRKQIRVERFDTMSRSLYWRLYASWIGLREELHFLYSLKSVGLNGSIGQLSIQRHRALDHVIRTYRIATRLLQLTCADRTFVYDGVQANCSLFVNSTGCPWSYSVMEFSPIAIDLVWT